MTNRRSQPTFRHLLSRVLAASLVLVSMSLASACASTGSAWGQGEEPPLAVKIRVTGLKQPERELLRDKLCGLEGVEECELKVRRKEARVTFMYRGPLSKLKQDIASMPQPGLNIQKAEVELGFEGYDNIAPTITLISPELGGVRTERSLFVVLEVPDRDTDEVSVNGNPAESHGRGRYSLEIPLEEGRNTVVIEAKDKEGNVATMNFPVEVDTTPPALEVTVEKMEGDNAKLKGSVERGALVTVNGKPVEMNLFGGWEAVVKTDPDRRTATVEAEDEHGNTTRKVYHLVTGALVESGD